MWQFNVGYDGKESKFRPHHWKPAACLEEKGTGSVTLNTTDWFETKIVISDNGTTANTYLRKAGDGDARTTAKAVKTRKTSQLPMTISR